MWCCLMDSYQLMAKFADIEQGMNRLLGEYQQLVAKQVAQSAQINRLHFMLTGKTFEKDKRFCKNEGCGMVIVGDEEHECKGKPWKNQPNTTAQYVEEWWMFHTNTQGTYP